MNTINYSGSYTHRDYHRGGTIKRDTVWESVVAPKCVMCGKTLERQVYHNGKLERITRWLQRKTCGRVWSAGQNKYVTGGCYKAFIDIPQNTPRYKGVCDIPCEICGKTNLSYTTGGRRTKRCKECHNLYRTKVN